MTSIEGESVAWVRSLNPADARGAVEKWLIRVEQIMTDSLRSLVLSATSAHPASQLPRGNWVLQWPGQVVLCVSSVLWTQQVTDAIMDQRHNHGALALCAKRCGEHLSEIVQRVRGTLTPVARVTLGAMVVLDVHARDVVDELCERQVHDVHEFQWQCQLRSDFDANGGIVVRMLNTVVPYAYEYLGNSGRLVITPLTERCYRTLMTALHFHLGGAPEGPAGTGKTETVKDLSKAVAVQCVVFNW
jgi:dynein heavy chain